MELAWETLDDEIKNKIKDKKAIHSSLGAGAFVDKYKAMEAMEIWMNIQMNIQLLRTHPETGKKFFC